MIDRKYPTEIPEGTQVFHIDGDPRPDLTAKMADVLASWLITESMVLDIPDPWYN